MERTIRTLIAPGGATAPARRCNRLGCEVGRCYRPSQEVQPPGLRGWEVQLPQPRGATAQSSVFELDWAVQPPLPRGSTARAQVSSSARRCNHRAQSSSSGREVHQPELSFELCQVMQPPSSDFELCQAMQPLSSVFELWQRGAIA